MTIGVGDMVEMKKPHPCGGRVFSVLRVGRDFKLKGRQCGHELMLPLAKAEKNIRKVLD